MSLDVKKKWLGAAR